METDIALDSVTFAFGHHPALSEVTARIPRGRVTALIGGNGAGKSTLLALLARTQRPASGHITGVPENAALVVQRSAVSDALPLTVRHTVMMGRWRERGVLGRIRGEDRRIVDASLVALGIRDLASRQLGRLSGGQKQRTLVAQGLAQQADLLLLDEPLAGVDAAAERAIAQAIDQLREQTETTIVLATHAPHQARRADHVIHLENGAMVQEGPPERIDVLIA